MIEYKKQRPSQACFISTCHVSHFNICSGDRMNVINIQSNITRLQLCIVAVLVPNPVLAAERPVNHSYIILELFASSQARPP